MEIYDINTFNCLIYFFNKTILSGLTYEFWFIYWLCGCKNLKFNSNTIYREDIKGSSSGSEVLLMAVKS